MKKFIAILLVLLMTFAAVGCNSDPCRKGHTSEPDAAVAPTCTETGLTEGEHCSVCGEVLLKQETIPALGHTEESVREAKEPTCTEAGISAEIKCSVCGETIQKAEVVPATGHTAEEIPAIDATCTEAGKTAGSKCSVCGEIITAQEDVAALGHAMSEYVSNGDAKCAEDGTKTAKCTRCGYSETVADEGSKLGHAEGVWKTEVVPSCNHTGTDYSYCSRCGERIDFKYTISTGHNYVNGVCTSCGAKNENGIEINKDIYHILTLDHIKTYYKTVRLSESICNAGTDHATVRCNVNDQVSFLGRVGTVYYQISKKDDSTVTELSFSTVIWGSHNVATLKELDSSLNAAFAAYLGVTPSAPTYDEINKGSTGDMYTDTLNNCGCIYHDYYVNGERYHLACYGGMSISANILMPISKDSPIMKK